MFSYPDRHFSTDALHTSKKLGAWREMISDVFFRVDIDTATTDTWSASISEVNLQRSSISRYITERARGVRSRHAISEDIEEFYIFVFPLEGTMYFSQYGREGVVSVGQYVMLRSSDFYNLSCDTYFNGIFLKLPTKVVDEVYKDAGRHCSNWRPAHPVLSKVFLSNLLAISDLTAEERNSYSWCLDRQLLGSLIAMLRAEEGGNLSSTSATHGLFERLTKIVEKRYSQETFTPAIAAAELKVSVGYMHRCVKANGTSFSELLRDVRLARSFEMLQDHTLRLQVGEIAYRNGFSDHSAFSKIFRQRYGKTPTELRDQLVTV